MIMKTITTCCSGLVELPNNRNTKNQPVNPVNLMYRDVQMPQVHDCMYAGGRATHGAVAEDAQERPVKKKIFDLILWIYAHIFFLWQRPDNQYLFGNRHSANEPG